MTELIQKELIDTDDNDEIEHHNIVRSTALESDRTMTDAADGLGTISDQGISEALSIIFASTNYKVYLGTAWIFSAFTYVWYYLTLYLRALGWDYILIGVTLASVTGVSAVMRLIGGYVGDTTNRKTLSVVAMFMMASYHLILGFFVDYVFIFAGLMVCATIDIAKSGSSAYIMENVPRDHSGFALSLFTAGRALGIVTLLAFGALVPIVGFPDTFRYTFIVAGVMLMLSTGLRAVYLKSSETTGSSREDSVLRGFLSENIRAFRLLLAVIPGLIAILIFDSISDGLFKFGALIYTNEDLNISISGINVLLLFTLVVSTPLLLKVGRLADRKGVKRAGLMVYSVMPISAGLLLIAPYVPLWAPESWYILGESAYTGLGVVFTIPFLAILMKYVNDALWWTVVLTLVQRSLPKQDTAKILAIFWVVIYLFQAVGQSLGGFLFAYSDPGILFTIVVVLNVLILLAMGMGKFGKNIDLTLVD
jgi:MFS family permease